MVINRVLVGLDRVWMDEFHMESHPESLDGCAQDFICDLYWALVCHLAFKDRKEFGRFQVISLYWSPRDVDKKYEDRRPAVSFGLWLSYEDLQLFLGGAGCWLYQEKREAQS